MIGKKNSLDSEINSLLANVFEDEEFEEDPEWLEDQEDVEKVFENLLEEVLLETDYFNVISTSPFSDSGVMTNNKCLVVEDKNLENQKGKVLKCLFEFYITIVKR